MLARRLFLPIALLVLTARNAFASGAGMPWEGPLNDIVKSLTGPIAKAVGIIAIGARIADGKSVADFARALFTGQSTAGGAAATTDGGSGAKTGLRIVFALSIVFSVGSFGLSFLGFSGGFAP